MKTVRLVNGIVIEVIPNEATMPNVAYWYGETFASQCVVAPDEVEQYWTYDSATNTFSETVQVQPDPTPTPEDIILDTLADHEYRLCLTELGAN